MIQKRFLMAGGYCALALILVLGACYLMWQQRWPWLVGAAWLAAVILIYRALHWWRHQSALSRPAGILWLAADGVESDTEYQTLLRWLTNLGYQTYRATATEDAVTRIGSQTPRFILLNAGHQNQAALALQLSRLRQASNLQRYSPILIIIAAPFSLATGLQLGCDDVWQLPGDERELEQLLLSWKNFTVAKPSKPSNPHSPIDIKLALKHSNNNRALAVELFNMLTQKLPENIAEIEAHFRNQETEPLTEAVHQLLGGTRYCGLPNLTTRCENLEKMLLHEQASPPEIATQLQELLEAAEDLLHWNRENDFARCLEN